MATETYVTPVAFEGYVITATVTSSGKAVEDWIQEIYSSYHRLLHKLIVGLDVEWRPSYSRVQNRVALLQLCVGRHCLIFQLLHADYIPEALEEFLDDPDFRFVDVGVQDDADRLSQDHDVDVANTEDLRQLAADGFHMPALRQSVMGANLQKPHRVRMGPWDASWLSQEQIEYACIDAFVSFEIGRKLLTGDYP